MLMTPWGNPKWHPLRNMLQIYVTVLWVMGSLLYSFLFIIGFMKAENLLAATTLSLQIYLYRVPGTPQRRDKKIVPSSSNSPSLMTLGN